MKALVTAAMAALVACGGRPASQAAPPPIGPTLGTTHIEESAEITPPLQALDGGAPTVPPGVQALLTATNQLDLARPEPDHRQVVYGLHALADALEVVVSAAPAEIQRIRQIGDELERSNVRAMTHSDFVRVGLDAAVRALDTAQHPDRADHDRVQATLDELANAATAIDPDRPLLEQYPAVRSAFHAATRAVFAVAAAPEPTFERAVPTAQR